MISLNRQKWIGLTFFLLTSALMVRLHAQFAGRMPRISFLTGWVLFGLILALTLYNARKKLPFLPLLSSEAWMQFHIYAGLLTGVAFAVHVSYRIPKGWFQGSLAGLYALVMLSGFFGLFVSRA